MSKKITTLIIALLVIICSQSVFAGESSSEWSELYSAKMEEIKSGYENGTKDTGGVKNYGFNVSYFSLQDINFDGVPEMYHAICSMFELDPYVEGNEEIYYIKDGKVMQGSIEKSSDFCLLPMNGGTKSEPGNTAAFRWQYAMRNRESGEVCFVTNDSYSGFIEFPDITYSKLSFDSATGVLKSEELLHFEAESYTAPVYLNGYDYVGADCYTSISSGEWNIFNWKSGYVAPKVVLNGEKIEFDVQPQLINNRTMVPLRAIFESLGAEVLWDGDTNTVTAIKDDVTVKMTVGADSFLRNGEKVMLDSPATIISSRTLVPVRAVAESFGSVVDWDDATQTVIINDTL